MQPPLPPQSPLPPLPPQPGLMQPENNKLAITAGWLGIGAIALYLLAFGAGLAAPGTQTICQAIGVLAALVGFVLGIIGLVQINKRPGQKGKGMAITGIVVGALVVCAAPVVIAVLLILGPVIGNVFTKINSTLMMP